MLPLYQNSRRRGGDACALGDGRRGDPHVEGPRWQTQHAAPPLVAATAAAQSPSRTDAPAVEVAHAAPIVALVDATATLVQGTAERGGSPATSVAASPDVVAFRFPATLGHLRGYATNKIPDTAAYGELPALFDAAGMIPPVSYTGCGRFDSSCRSVFTTVTAGERPVKDVLGFHPLELLRKMLSRES